MNKQIDKDFVDWVKRKAEQQQRIEEMAKIIAQSIDEETICDGLAGDSGMACFGCDYSEKEYCKHHLESATGLYNKGYRKTEDVAMEIFEEIEKIIKEPFAVGFDLLSRPEKVLPDYNNGIRKQLLYYVAELKKKYESEGADDD
jgi:hypothetical protein